MWEPDWVSLELVALEAVTGVDVKAIIESYRRQQAERGMVDVGSAQIDTVLGILDALILTANDEIDEIDVDMLVHARDILAAAQEQR